MKNLHYEQFAGSNFHYAKHSLDFFLNSMDRLGIRYIEFYLNYPHLSMFDAGPADVERVAKKIKERNIRLCCTTLEQCGPYPINLATEDDAVRKRSIATMEKVLEYSAVLECPVTQVLGGWASFDLPAEDAWKRVAESFFILTKKAESVGVGMVIEAASKYTTNTIYSVPLIRKMLDEINHPYLNAMLDNCATETAGDDFRDSVALLGSNLRHMHFADGDPGGHYIPGEGNLPMKSYIDALDDANYKGAISFELYNKKYEFEPELYMKKCFEYAASLF